MMNHKTSQLHNEFPLFRNFKRDRNNFNRISNMKQQIQLISSSRNSNTQNSIIIAKTTQSDSNIKYDLGLR